MRLDEVFGPMFEMTFERKVVERKFRGREETISEHLVKLLAFSVSEETRRVWKREIRNHLFYLSGLRLKGQGNVPEETIRQWLVIDPFGETEESTIERYIMMHEDLYDRNEMTPAAIYSAIVAFWNVAIPMLSRGETPTALISQL